MQTQTRQQAITEKLQEQRKQFMYNAGDRCNLEDGCGQLFDLHRVDDHGYMVCPDPKGPDGRIFRTLVEEAAKISMAPYTGPIKIKTDISGGFHMVHVFMDVEECGGDVMISSLSSQSWESLPLEETLAKSLYILGR